MTTILMVLTSLLAAAGASAVLLWLALRHRERLPLAAPNARSLHATPVPRVGGIAIWAGWLAGLAVVRAMPPGGAAGALALAAMFMVSLVDDRHGVHPALRLSIHLVAACVATFAVWRTGVVGPGYIPLLVLAMGWGANAFNFMDGSDDLAAAMAMVGFGAYALASPTPAEALTCWLLVAATLPFAVVNYPPARVFMGDCGAVPLGFAAVTWGAAQWMDGRWPAWFPALVFLPFLADATVTLARRLLRRERVWEAHRQHYYQRLVRLGAGHAGTLYLYAALMVGGAASAVLTLRCAPASGWIVLAAWCLADALLFVGIDYHWRKRRLSPT